MNDRSSRLLQIAAMLLLVLGCVVLFSRSTARSSARAADPGDDKDALPTFVVADVGQKIKIIAYGDLRATDPADYEHTNPKVRRNMIAGLVAEKPNVLLISGDLPYRGGKDSDWQMVDNEFKPLWDAKIRLYPALGNHELMGGEERGLSNWWKRFPDLQGRRWYSVLFRNCYFITLDSTSNLSAKSAQEAWLEKQLAHLPAEADFIFLDMHHPPYTDSKNHFIPGIGHAARDQEKRLAARLEALQPRVRGRFIVIAGHVHNYERFEYSGVTYIVSGGGGATPYVFDRSTADKYQAARGPTYNYVRFEVDGTRLTGKMFKLNTGDENQARFDEKDSFELTAVPLATPASQK